MSKLSLKNCSIMFHHFHSKTHVKSQGSITQKKFEKIIKKIGLSNILSAKSFLKKKKKICLSFDDGLKCQYDVALPILNKYKIKAFWFIYTSALKPGINNIELFRIFRNKKFNNFNSFYKSFTKYIDGSDYKFFLKKQKKKIEIVKKDHPFYNINEIKFRFLRDKYLKKEDYFEIVKKLYIKHKFNYKKEMKNIFLKTSHLKKLSKSGHIIGLHSHSHPTDISTLPIKKQKDEYSLNKKILEKIIKKKIIVSAHPCGKYDSNTLKILKKLGIILGFGSKLKKDKKYLSTYNKNLIIPREDHANL